jgi:L-iditol 2-dehydrogenase
MRYRRSSASRVRSRQPTSRIPVQLKAGSPPGDDDKETTMYAPAGVNTSLDHPVPDTMKAWVLGDPGELALKDKAVPVPKRAEVLVRIDAVAICATDLEIIYSGPPALIQGGMPFNKNFTPGHEYMGTVVALGPGVDEYNIGQRVTVEIHAGCGQCKRCREGMYTACHNYGLNYGDVDKGHRANGFTTDGGFCEYQVNNINTLVAIPDQMSDEEATLVVTAGTAMYGLTELGGLVAGESVVVTGPGPIGLLGVAVAKALGAHPVILTGTRDNRLKIGLELGADHVVNVRQENPVEAVRKLNGGKGVDYVLECSAAANAVNEALRMVNRGGKVCLAAFPHEEVPVDIAHIVRNNIYVYGIRGEGKSATHRAGAFMTQRRFDATRIHTHTFALEDLPTAIRYAKDRVEDAIKVVVKARGVPRVQQIAAE